MNNQFALSSCTTLMREGGEERGRKRRGGEREEEEEGRGGVGAMALERLGFIKRQGRFNKTSHPHFLVSRLFNLRGESTQSRAAGTMPLQEAHREPIERCDND